MKKGIFGVMLFMITFLSSEGQWYVRQYNVSDINQLNKGQLEVSLVKSQNNLLTSCMVAGLGALGWGILNIAHVAIIGSYICGGVFIGGAIVSIGYMQRIAKIKSAIRRNYPSPTGSLSFSPVIIKNNYTRTYSSGISFRYNF